MLYYFIFIALNTVMIQAMDVDTEPVTKKRKRNEQTTTEQIPTSTSSALSDRIALSDAQTELCKWAIDETTQQVDALKKHAPLTYPYGTFASAHPEKIGRINRKAENVTENKEIFEQNMLIRIANEIALKLHGTHKLEFSGDDAVQTKLLHQAQDDLAKLTNINDALYNRCNAPEPTQPLKKQKQ